MSDEDIPTHNVEYWEVLFIRCPSCKDRTEIAWGDLEEGSFCKCDACNYEFYIGVANPQ